MIGFLRGKIKRKHPPWLWLEVQGIGYEIEAPMTTFYNLPDLDQDVELFTHLLVREDAHLLYGFVTERERLLFRTLIKVSGIGAKMALAILSGMEADEFVQCIKNNDTHRLTTVPGIGKKTAERLLVEIRDRLDSVFTDSKDQQVDKSNVVDEAIGALTALGYKPAEARHYVEAVNEGNMNSEELIRTALKYSAKQ